jgi:ATP-dependent DNA ligase
VLSATFEEPGNVVFRHACAMRLEGIVSKRLYIRTPLGTLIRYMPR